MGAGRCKEGSLRDGQMWERGARYDGSGVRVHACRRRAAGAVGNVHGQELEWVGMAGDVKKGAGRCKERSLPGGWQGVAQAMCGSGQQHVRAYATKKQKDSTQNGPRAVENEGRRHGRCSTGPVFFSDLS
jgi:hypothetical protein